MFSQCIWTSAIINAQWKSLELCEKYTNYFYLVLQSNNFSSKEKKKTCFHHLFSLSPVVDGWLCASLFKIYVLNDGTSESLSIGCIIHYISLLI